jgi:hypothetical protein
MANTGKKDIAEHNTRLEQTKLDLSQLSSDELEAKQRAFLQQEMQKASQPWVRRACQGSR